VVAEDQKGISKLSRDEIHDLQVAIELLSLLLTLRSSMNPNLRLSIKVIVEAKWWL
jgi:hypothetical protein